MSRHHHLSPSSDKVKLPAILSSIIDKLFPWLKPVPVKVPVYVPKSQKIPRGKR